MSYEMLFIFGSAALAFLFTALIAWLTYSVSAIWTAVLFTLSLTLYCMLIATFFCSKSDVGDAVQRLNTTVVASSVAFAVCAVNSGVWYASSEQFKKTGHGERIASLYGALCGLTVSVVGIIVGLVCYYQIPVFRRFMDSGAK